LLKQKLNRKDEDYASTTPSLQSVSPGPADSTAEISHDSFNFEAEYDYELSLLNIPDDKVQWDSYRVTLKSPTESHWTSVIRVLIGEKKNDRIEHVELILDRSSPYVTSLITSELHLTAIDNLQINESPLYGNSISHICALNVNQQLRTLDVDCCDLAPNDAIKSIVQSLKGNTSLKVLSLTSSLSPYDLNQIMTLHDNTTIIEIHLGSKYDSSVIKQHQHYNNMKDRIYF
jgi:hypothetical protein